MTKLQPDDQDPTETRSEKTPRSTKPFGASKQFLSEVLKIGETIAVPSGSMLFEAGQPTHGVYIVLQGKFALWSGEDPVRITRIADRGCLLGLPATIRQKPYGLSAEAVINAQVCRLSPEQFKALLAKSRQAREEVLLLLAEEISTLRRLAVYEVSGDRD
jgi:CRP-like cAMP-binding protein